ncbi:hypothetical protein E2C01_067481 [Portunus trituberculatus]|uniref:Uncharacterized protein n=1 Tax=Portunus trituberculatus TaxID=210409 RepID=A0A5B7HSR1_PORTR|nr:hypothetical protein [Portunus trituberculatus]
MTPHNLPPDPPPPSLPHTITSTPHSLPCMAIILNPPTLAHSPSFHTPIVPQHPLTATAYPRDTYTHTLKETHYDTPQYTPVLALFALTPTR